MSPSKSATSEKAVCGLSSRMFMFSIYSEYGTCKITKNQCIRKMCVPYFALIKANVVLLWHNNQKRARACSLKYHTQYVRQSNEFQFQTVSYRRRALRHEGGHGRRIAWRMGQCV